MPQGKLFHAIKRLVAFVKDHAQQLHSPHSKLAAQGPQAPAKTGNNHTREFPQAEKHQRTENSVQAAKHQGQPGHQQIGSLHESHPVGHTQSANYDTTYNDTATPDGFITERDRGGQTPFWWNPPGIKGGERA